VYLSIWECLLPRDLPVEAVPVDKDDLLDLGLGQSIYVHSAFKIKLKNMNKKTMVIISRVFLRISSMFNFNTE
jgi:hypothetical protein